MLRFASEELWGDKEVVIEAVRMMAVRCDLLLKSCGETRRWSWKQSDGMMAVRCDLLLKNCGVTRRCVLRFASEVLWRDKEVVMEALQHHCGEPEFASKKE